MKVIKNITDEAGQKHYIPVGDYELIIDLKFLPTVEMWTINIEYREDKINGTKLSLGTLHFRSNNLPFDFVVIDNEDTGIDPYSLDDFESGRCSLVMLEADDMEERRGYSVEQ